MRKLILFLVVVVMALTLMGGLALAGGWSTIGNTHNPDNGEWGSNQSPHGGYNTTTNKCRVCHAVHLATGSQWRLLKGATGPKSECDGCHGQSGLTAKKPYWTSITVRGEHRLDKNAGSNQAIPDSEDTTGANDATVVSGGLICNTCHSVHGAGTFINDPGNLYNDTYNAYILRKDPNKDTAEADQRGGGLNASAYGAYATNKYAVLSGFCADCHNKNPNWNGTGAGLANETSTRENPISHVQGPDAQGTLSVGGADTSVAGWIASGVNADVQLGQNAVGGCRSCHNAGDSIATGLGENLGGGSSAFPHRSSGSKLLFDGYTNESAVSSSTGDPTRVLPAMDRVCGTCHDQDASLGGTDNGVGRSF